MGIWQCGFYSCKDESESSAVLKHRPTHLARSLCFIEDFAQPQVQLSSGFRCLLQVVDSSKRQGRKSRKYYIAEDVLIGPAVRTLERVI